MRKLTFLLLAAAVLGACNAPQYRRSTKRPSKATSMR